MIDSFIINALTGGTLIALMAGVLGCFVTWQRLAFFGDTVGHAALLGVALALVAQLPIVAGVLIVAVSLAVVFFWLQRNRAFAGDALLGVLAHAALASGLVTVALFDIKVDLNVYLFGDILAIGHGDIFLIAVCAALIVAWVAWQWRPLMMLVLSEDIAQVEGMRTRALRLTLMVVIAIATAISFRVSGMLLVTALLVVPAAAARCFAATPMQMVLLAALTGCLSVWGGIGASMLWDTPSGPSVILTAVALFIVGRVVTALKVPDRR